MVTVGLVKELFFISRVLNDTFYLKLFKGELQDNELCLKMEPNAALTVYYQGYEIWREIVEGDTSFFGVESCDSISRIIACIDNGDMDNARRLIKIPQIFIDKKPSPS
jgi:hypothetical protein